MKRKILFICTGNYYRSRFAEILFNHLARQKRLNWIAGSCGTEVFKYQNEGSLAASAVKMLQLLSIPVGAERFPSQLTESALEQADIIIALKKAEHKPPLARDFPHYERKVIYWHVHDLDMATPEQALGEIRELVEKLVKELG